MADAPPETQDRAAPAAAPVDPAMGGEGDAALLRGAGTFVLAGLLVGLVFGAVVVFKGALAALILAFFAGVGCLFGLAVWAVTSERTDVRGALNTFLRRPPR